MPRRLVVASLAVLGLLALAVAVAIGVLSDARFTTQAAYRVVAALDAQIPARIAFTKLSVNPVRGHVALDGLRVASPKKPEEAFLAARQITLDLDLLALFTGKVRVSRIHLVNPEATIVHEGKDRYNFQDALPPPDPDAPAGGGPPSFLALDRVTFEGGRLTYVDAPRKIEAEIPHLEGSLDLELAGPEVDGQVRFAKGWVTYDGIKQPLDSLRLDGGYDGKRALVRSLVLDAGQTQLGLQGRVTGLDGPPERAGLALEGELSTRLAQWAALVKQPISGRVQASLSAAGTVAAPRLAATVSGQQLGYRDLRVTALSARLAGTPERVRLERLTAALWNGKLQAEGEAALGPKPGPVSLKASGAGLELARALAELGVDGVPAGAAARADFALTASAPRPEPALLQASLRASLAGRAPVSGRALPLTARLDGTLRRGRAELSALVVDALGARLTASGSVTPFAKTPRYALAGRLRNLEAAALAPYLPPEARGKLLAAVSGDFSLTGESFSAPRLAVRADLRASGRLLPGAAGNTEPVPFSASAALALAGDRVRLTRLSAEALGGALTASGAARLDPDAPDLRAEATLAGLDLAALNRAFAVVKGPLTGRADGRFAYANERLLISDFSATPFGGRVTARGQVGLERPEKPRYQLAVTASGIDLARVSPLLGREVPLAGRAGGELAISGRGADFRVAGPVSALGLAYAPAPELAGARQVLPFKLGGRVAATPREVRLTPLTMTLGRSTLRAEGRVALGGASNFALKGHVVDSPTMAALLGVPGLTGGELTLDGRAFGPPNALRFETAFTLGPTRLKPRGLALGGASGRLEGTLDRRLRMQGTLTATELTTPAQAVSSLSLPIAYEAPAERLAEGTLRARGALARLGGGRVTASGELDLGRRHYSAQVASAGLRLGDLDALSGPQAVRAPEGTPLSLAFSGAGPLDAPRGELRIALAGFSVEQTAFGPSNLALALRGDHAALDGTAFGGAYRVVGRVPLDPAGRVDLTLRFVEARLEPLLALLPRGLTSAVELPAEGELEGTVKVAGPLAEPGRLAAEVDLSRLALAYRDLELHNEGPLRLSYAGDRLRLARFRLAGTGTAIEASGFVGLGVPSALRASGALNLAFLEKLAPQALADASGTARFEAALRGTLGSPDVTGELDVQDATLNARALPQAIRDFDASLRLTRSRVFLDALSATLGYTGRITANGAATLGPDFMPESASLQLRGQEVAFRQKDLNVLANADLTFSGTPESARLDGQVQVIDGKFSQYVSLPDLARPAAQRGRSTDLSRVPFLKNLALRLQVLVPGQFRVDNNLARADVRGDVLVLGTALRPGLVGRAEALNGRFYFQDHTYALDEASVDFTDPTRIAPYLHTVASTRIQGVDVRLQANGTPEALKVELSSSDPKLTQQDLLVLVATGQLPDAGGGASGFDAGNFVLGQLASGVGRNFVERGVVDTVRIQQRDDAATGQAAGPALTVGKRINESLTLSYSQDLTMAQGAQSAGAGSLLVFDYLLTEGVVVRLEQRLDGGFNATARYRVTFR